MKRLSVTCTLAALLLVPVGAAADDLSCRLSRGGFVTLSIDSDGGSVAYGIFADDLGNLSSAEIRQGNQTVVDLDIQGNFGSASGSTNAGGADLADIEANPGSYSVRVAGTGGNNACSLQSAGGSSSGGAVIADLVALKINGKPNGRLIARVRNLGPADQSLATSVAFFASDDQNLSNDDVRLGAATLTSIREGRKKKTKERIEWPPALSGETVWVIAVVDELNVNDDPNRSNNTNVSRKQVDVP